MKVSLRNYSASLSEIGLTSIVVLILTAYQDVRSDKSDTNWLLLDYEVRI